VSTMALLNIADLEEAIREVARVLVPRRALRVRDRPPVRDVDVRRGQLGDDRRTSPRRSSPSSASATARDGHHPPTGRCRRSPARSSAPA
jgi:hypothetical protein